MLTDTLTVYVCMCVCVCVCVCVCLFLSLSLCVDCILPGPQPGETDPVVLSNGLVAVSMQPQTAAVTSWQDVRTGAVTPLVQEVCECMCLCICVYVCACVCVHRLLTHSVYGAYAVFGVCEFHEPDSRQVFRLVHIPLRGRWAGTPARHRRSALLGRARR
jgi:hypothetical protein